MPGSRPESGDLQQFRLGPGVQSISGGGADFGDGFGINRGRGVAPFAADVGEDGGEVVVAQGAPGGHVEAVADFADLDGAADAVEGDAGEALDGAGDPLGIGEGRGGAFDAEAVVLMARAADGGVEGFAGVEAGLLRGGEGLDGDFVGGTWFAGPGEKGEDVVDGGDEGRCGAQLVEDERLGGEHGGPSWSDDGGGGEAGEQGALPLAT